MALNYRRERKYAERLGEGASELSSIRNKLDNSMNNLIRSYKGEEVSYVIRHIEQLKSQLNSTYREMDDIESDIRSVAYEIYREDRRREERAKLSI